MNEKIQPLGEGALPRISVFGLSLGSAQVLLLDLSFLATFQVANWN